MFDVVYLACHGRKLGEDPQEAALQLGGWGRFVTLPEISTLHLKRCLVVLQACWTRSMEHMREFPVQGFPQAFLDAGASDVIAPMLPVIDPLCPVFTSVFCRALRFRPAGEALGYALEVLRGRGKVLVPKEVLVPPSAFDGTSTASPEIRRLTSRAVG
jgi:CHAT domain-containing protein